jgi:predicted alpha/beta superfamily hydrolase
MKILFTALWISFFLQSIIIPQRKIEIRVISALPQNQKVFITGNTSELGNWNPNQMLLNKLNDSTWSKVFEFREGETIEYKFTLGSWEKEALNEKGQKSGNNILKISDDTVLVFNITNWGYSQINISGQITGNIRYHKNFKGRSVLPRDIIVWLPPSYDSLPDKYYPVLYMHDGQNIFDPLTSSFGVDWQIDEVADSLIGARSIQEIIIIGIYNTEKRGNEYNITNLGQAYVNFIIEELKPFIDSTYKTLPDCKNTTVSGSSSGGLISFIMAWENPDVFSKTACFSPAFKISNIDYVAPVKKYIGAKKDLKIFIYNGGVGLEEQLQPGIDEMMLVLKEKGFVENQDLLFIKDSSAEHNESAWAKNVYRFLEFFFPLEK